MMLKRLLQCSILLVASWSTPAVHAQQREVQINFVNAGTCDFNPASEPNGFIATTGAFIAGRNAVAFCSIPSPFTDLFSDLFQLNEILYTGMIRAPGAITGQLCVYTSAVAFMVACSPESTPEGTGLFTQRLRPPQVTGFFPLGAFLIVRFSDQTLSFIYQIRSAWERITVKAPTKLLNKTLPPGLVAFNTVASASRVDPTVLEPFGDKKAQQQVAEYLRRLAQALEQEKREEPWATDMEMRLRDSFVGAGLGSGILDSVECRSSQCQLKIRPGGDPMEAITQQAKVSKWLGAIMNCGYTMVSGESNSGQAPAPVHIYIQCGMNSGEDRKREK